MCLGFLFGPTKSTIASGRMKYFAVLTIMSVLLLAFLQSVLVGCAKKEQQPESTPTSGSMSVFASPAIAPVIQTAADQFNRLYPKANVNVYSLNSRAIVDSLVNRRTEVGYFDRSLSQAESLAIIRTRKQLFSFRLGSTVATWVVNPKNAVSTIDSVQALEILTGQVTSWRAMGGSGDKINIYLPPLGDGAWTALEGFFGAALTKVDAHYWPSDSLVLARVAEDPSALGFVGKQVYDTRVKKLRWRDPILAEPVAPNIGSLQEGKYPFRIRLCYYTIADRSDLASGFLSFMSSNVGQRVIADQGFLPEMVPARVFTLPSSGKQK
jgi:phosphate transport system substrate-binding protein